jgi:peptidoglycan/LPS O-acetylase OafA/YrhL
VETTEEGLRMSIPSIDRTEDAESTAQPIVLPERIALIDGLRGFAALAVVFYHFNDRLQYGSWYGWLMGHGSLGVALFFVLSGFVIAMSIGDREVTGSFVGRFALRRSLRLDPPYWLSIAAILVIGAFGARFGAHQQTPTTGALFAHLIYLQDILRYPAISPIYWTLCYEIQFYLFLALILWASRRYAVEAVLVTAGLSLACHDIGVAANWFANFWFCFALGALTFWHLKGRASMGQWGILAVAVGINSLATGDIWGWAALASASLILICARRLDFLSGAAPQFLGRISYSIYLTHVFFGWYALSIAMKFMPGYAALPVGMLACILGAWGWYLLIEQPSIKLSKRISLKASSRIVQSQLPVVE